jgi:ribosomal protein L11 methyltransferase
VALLWEHGTQGIEVQPTASGGVVLLAYFPDRHGLALEITRALASLTGTEVTQVAVPDVDWVARFREGFRSFNAGSFTIVPEWEAPGSAAGPRVIRVDPGRAFGTGTHETTRLCLQALEGLAARRPLGATLDVGTGTGILAVAAAELGATPVVAVDFDPESVAAARVHARLNAVTLHVVLGDGGRPFAPRRFDVVLANITAPLLVERRHEIAALSAAGGAVVLSGLLQQDADAVCDAYSALGVPRVLRDGDWVGLVFETGRPW